MVFGTAIVVFGIAIVVFGTVCRGFWNSLSWFLEQFVVVFGTIIKIKSLLINALNHIFALELIELIELKELLQFLQTFKIKIKSGENRSSSATPQI